MGTQAVKSLNQMLSVLGNLMKRQLPLVPCQPPVKEHGSEPADQNDILPIAVDDEERDGEGAE